jgi:hypothetical protein
MYGSISPLNHHRMKAWQSGGVHVRPGEPAGMTLAGGVLYS